MAALGRGCVKTLKSQQGGELFSLLPFFRLRPQHCSSLDWRNQEGLSTLRLVACVFTQPRASSPIRRVVSYRLQSAERGHSPKSQTCSYTSSEDNHQHHPVGFVIRGRTYCPVAPRLGRWRLAEAPHAPHPTARSRRASPHLAVSACWFVSAPGITSCCSADLSMARSGRGRRRSATEPASQPSIAR